MFNSHHNLEYGFKMRQEYPDKMTIYRLEEPVSIIRGKDKAIDKILPLFDKLFD